MGVKVLIPPGHRVRLRTDLESEGLKMSTMKMSPLLLLLAVVLYCEWVLFSIRFFFLFILLLKLRGDKINVTAATWFLRQLMMLEKILKVISLEYKNTVKTSVVKW